MNPASPQRGMTDKEAADYFRREYEQQKFVVEVLEKQNAELKLEKIDLQAHVKRLETGVIKFLTEHL